MSNTNTGTDQPETQENAIPQYNNTTRESPAQRSQICTESSLKFDPGLIAVAEENYYSLHWMIKDKLKFICIINDF